MPAGFGLMEIMIPTIGIRAIGLEFETHPARVGEEIVGHWFNAPRVLRDMD